MKNTKKLFIAIVAIVIVGLGGYQFLSMSNNSALELIQEGQYDKAIQKLSLVKIFNKSDEIQQAYDIAVYEQEAVAVVSDLFEQFEETYKDIRQATSVTEVEVECRELREVMDELDALEVLEGSEISDFVKKIKDNNLYTLLKNDYVFGDNLKKINMSFSTNSTLSAMAVYTATEIPSDCIDTILQYGLPSQVETYRANK